MSMNQQPAMLIPQVAEVHTPQPQDVVGEYVL